MTKKFIVAILALSMVCSSFFMVFANESEEKTPNSEANETNNIESLESNPVQSTPVQSSNPAPKGNFGTVKLVGQWTGESSKKISTDKVYEWATDKIGSPVKNGGLLRGLAKTFLAWSDKPPVDNGHLQEGARYFSPEDPISLAFPDGIPEGAELYAVYFSILDNDAPFTGKLDILAINRVGEKFKTLINKNKVIINNSIDGEATRPDTPNYRDDVDGDVRTMLDYYKNKVNNEVILSSEFYMDPTIALVTYRNPVGSNQLRPILSRDYDKRKGDGGDFSTDKGRDAGYTHVDLNVDLHEGFQIPEVFYLEFFGYSWRPLYVMDENNNKLEIFDPSNDESLGSDKNSFNSLVNNTNPKVRFAIKPNGASKITIRVILREDYNSNKEKIAEKDISPDQDKTITETILSNMTLKCLSRGELKSMRSDLKDEDLNKRILRISDEKARELAKSNGEETLLVNGNIKGHMFVSAGNVSFFRLASDTAINETKSNDLKLGYVPNNVYYKFVSGTKGKALPNEIMAKLPKNNEGVLDQDKIALPGYQDVKVSDGVWSFESWYNTDDKFENDARFIGNRKALAVSRKATVESPDDLYLLGVWTFKSNSEPTDNNDNQNIKTDNNPSTGKSNSEPADNNDNQNIKTDNNPSTGDSGSQAIYILIVALLSLVTVKAIAKIKD